MPAYLSRIAAAATRVGGNRVSISPAIRSRSPIAERDQRLTLTDTDWDFEDTLGSVHLTPDTRAPRESSLPTEPKATKQTPENSTENPSEERSAATFPVAEILPDRPDQRQRSPGEATATHSGVARSRDESSMIEQPIIGPGPVARDVPPPMPKTRAEATSPQREPLMEIATESGESPSRLDPLRTHQSVQARAATPQSSVPLPENAYAEFFSMVAKSAPPTHEPVAVPRFFSETRSPEQSRSPLLPPMKDDTRLRRLDPLTAEQAPEPARSGVIIDHLQVEVVPVPAEQAKPKPASSAPARSAPVSQIGPLRGTARQLAFSVRHR